MLVKENLELEDIHQKSKVIANEVMVTASKASVPLTSNEKADIEQVFSEKTIELSERADRILKDQPSLSENELAIKLIKEDLKNASMFSPMKRILKKAIKHLEEKLMISNLKHILPLLKKIIIFIYGHREELEKYASYTAEVYVAVARAVKQRQKLKQK